MHCYDTNKCGRILPRAYSNTTNASSDTWLDRDARDARATWHGALTVTVSVQRMSRAWFVILRVAAELQASQHREGAQIQTQGRAMEPLVITRGNHIRRGIKNELPATGCTVLKPFSTSAPQADGSLTGVYSEIVLLNLHQSATQRRVALGGHPTYKMSMHECTAQHLHEFAGVHQYLYSAAQLLWLPIVRTVVEREAWHCLALEARGHVRADEYQREVVALPQPEAAQRDEPRHSDALLQRLARPRLGHIDPLSFLQRGLGCNLQPAQHVRPNLLSS